MCTERALVTLNAVGAVLALAAATLWPRPGDAALLVPLAGSDIAGVIAWAGRERAPLLALDSARGRVIARLAGDSSVVSALGAGMLPLAARASTCQSRRTR